MSTAIRPWTASFGFLEPFRHEMEGVMEKFFGKTDGMTTLTAWSPRVDVEETDMEIVVKADLPGVDPKAIDIAVQDGVLTVRGEKKEQKEEKKKNYHCSERFTGSFYRAITLPPGADTDKIAATTVNGVVTITVPKKPEAQPKRIAVTPKM